MANGTPSEYEWRRSKIICGVMRKEWNELEVFGGDNLGY
jgi:hypothetical protein